MAENLTPWCLTAWRLGRGEGLLFPPYAEVLAKLLEAILGYFWCGHISIQSDLVNPCFFNPYAS